MIRWLLTAVIALAPLVAGAQTTPEVDVVGGRDAALPIAVVPFSGSAGETDIAAVVRADLQRSGQFKALPEARMTEKPTTGPEVHYATWHGLGQDYLLIGRVSGGGSVRVEYELYDVVKQQRLLGFAKSGPAGSARDIAHQIADDIYQKVLGVRGAFWTRVAYVRSIGVGKGAEYSLIVADADGYNAHVLQSSSKPLMSPSWSRDGNSLAYVSFSGGNSAVMVRSLAGGEARTVASFPGMNSAPSFLPDGRLLVTLSRDGNPEIYSVGAGGGAPTRLTSQLGIDTSAAWGGDGIYFTSDRGGHPQIYRMGAGGGAASRVTNGGDYNADAAFSADGKVMAVTQGRGGQYRIAVMDRGSAASRWTTVSTGSLDGASSVAPNGSMVVYSAREGASNVLYVVSADGRVRERLQAAGNGQDPAWSPYRTP